MKNQTNDADSCMGWAGTARYLTHARFILDAARKNTSQVFHAAVRLPHPPAVSAPSDLGGDAAIACALPPIKIGPGCCCGCGCCCWGD